MIKRSKPYVFSLFEMELAVANFFGINSNIIVPNISWGVKIHECDLFIIKKSGYVVEIEIKRSKTDLLKDFEKKHAHKDNRIKEFYYAIPQEQLIDALLIIPINIGVIEYKDRLLRFGFEEFELICKKFKTNIIIIDEDVYDKNKNNVKEITEITEDLVAIIHHFQ